MALCYWLLMRRLPEKGDRLRGAWNPIWPAFVIGLGWLVRPDAALYAAFFALALLVQSRLSITSWLGALVVAILVPGAYQVFRMGYYAALVPNTALAKDASGSKWEQGLYYLLDYAIPYSIWFPLLLAVAVLAGPVVRWARGRELRTLVTVLSPVPAAILHVLYMVRVGGDFMHGRFLLPATFALMLPVAVVGLRRGQQAMTFIAAVAIGWAIAVGSGARVPYTWDIDTVNDDYSGRPLLQGVANERAFWHQRTLAHRSMHRSDWRGSGPVEDAYQVWSDLRQGRSYYRDDELWSWLQKSSTPDELRQIHAEVERRKKIPGARNPETGLFDTVNGQGMYLVTWNMGIKGVYAGNQVHLVDRLALTDAVTAKTKPISPPASRLGHRDTNPAWALARYTNLGDVGNRHVRDAAVALQCGDLPELQAATTAPLTWDRFWRNVKVSPRLTFLTIPEEPTLAREQLCGWAPPVVQRP